MKKQVKIISTILMVLVLVASVSTVVLGSGEGLLGTIDKIGNGSGTAPTQITDLGAKIVTVMQTVGIVVAVVVLLILGIKYMMGSAEEKAEYKKTMIPYVVGAILIFAATTIVKVVYDLANSLNN